MHALPHFEYLEPASLGQAADMLRHAGDQCMVIGGGTDLVPSMRQGLFAPKYLLSLQAIDTLRGIQWEEGVGLRIGALATLRSVESDPQVLRRFPLVAKGAFEVASPSIRQMATVGGNICLDTRCSYYNQSENWRRVSSACLKMGGEFCKASPGGRARKCFSAFSADLATVLVALGAQVTLLSGRGERTIALRDFYTGDGAKPNSRISDEILTHVLVPGDKVACLGTYLKYRPRDTIDYPIASVALTLQPTDRKRVFEDVCLVISGVTTRPVVVKGVAELMNGKPLDDGLIEQAAQLARTAAIPVANTAGTRSHRKLMIHEFARKAFADLLQPLDA